MDGLVAGSYLLTALLLALPRPSATSTLANRLLAAAIAAVGILSLEFLVLVDNDFPNTLSLLPFSLSYAVFGPLNVLAVDAYSMPGRQLQRRDLGWLIFVLPIAALAAVLQLDGWPNGRITDIFDHPLYYLLNAFYMFLTVACTMLSIRKLRRHQHQRKLVVSDDQQADLGWLLNVLYALPILLVVWLNGLVDTHDYEWAFEVIQLLLITYVSYHALFQPMIYAIPKESEGDIRAVLEQGLSAEPLTSFLVDGPKAQPSQVQPLLSDAQAAAYAKTLDAYILKERPYLHPKLTLVELASATDMRPQELSFLLNQVYGLRFYTFINEHRVAFAKTLLEDPAYDNLNLVGIASESGFGSKTTFNAAFKASTASTPSGYRASRKVKH